MYHRVWSGMADGLTISPERLREQWLFMEGGGYQTLSLPEYLDMVNGKVPMKEKAVLITFDDGYVNNLQYAYPLLQELGWKATFFIIGNTVDGTNEDTQGGVEQKMGLAELQQLDPKIVQLALHGYDHENMRDINLPETELALKKALRAFDKSGLVYHKVLAYPYGARPEDMPALKDIMKAMGITAAFRIGNSISPVPAPDIYELKRVDIKGTDGIKELKIKLSKGKLKPF
jgi:peptidoglycan/xylan/chitin deacetylase (PgdA/CDA1 family)